MTVMATRQLRRVSDVDVELLELSARWPLGAPVWHEAGWIGEVVDAGPPEFPVLDHDGAHAVLGWRGSWSIAAVAVEWRVEGRRAVAWYAPHVLRRAGSGARR